MEAPSPVSSHTCGMPCPIPSSSQLPFKPVNNIEATIFRIIFFFHLFVFGIAIACDVYESHFKRAAVPQTTYAKQATETPMSARDASDRVGHGATSIASTNAHVDAQAYGDEVEIEGSGGNGESLDASAVKQDTTGIGTSNSQSGQGHGTEPSTLPPMYMDGSDRCR